MNKIIATLNPNACDPSLILSQGNLVVSTNANSVNYNRMVQGTLPLATGQVAFECQVWSTSRSTLTNIFSVGVALQNETVTGNYVGQSSTSCGLRTSDGAGNAGIYNNNTLATALPQIDERHTLGVYLSNDPVTPIVAFHLDGNYLGQFTLTAGKFYVPALSIGNDGSNGVAGDVSAFVNFGQRPFDYPTFTVFR